MTDFVDPIAARDQAFKSMTDIAENIASVVGHYRWVLVEHYKIHPEAADRICEDYAYNLHCQMFHGGHHHDEH